MTMPERLPVPSELNDRQQRFVEEYLVDLNPSAAYRRAGYAVDGNAQVVAVAAARLLKNVQVAALVAARRGELMQRLGITQEHVLREYQRIAFADVRNVAKVSADGVDVVASEEWSDDAAAAVAEVGEQRGKYGTSVRVKLHDKLAALNKLAEYTEVTRPAGGGGGGNVNINGEKIIVMLDV